MPDWWEAFGLPLAVGVIAGIILLLFEYRTRWFAQRQPPSERQGDEQGQAPADETAAPEGNRATEQPERRALAPSEIRGNVQIGNPIIRVLRGVRVFRNWQIGRGRIEVTGQDRSDEEE